MFTWQYFPYFNWISVRQFYTSKYKNEAFCVFLVIFGNFRHLFWRGSFFQINLCRMQCARFVLQQGLSKVAQRKWAALRSLCQAIQNKLHRSKTEKFFQWTLSAFKSIIISKDSRPNLLKVNLVIFFCALFERIQIVMKFKLS